MSSFLKPFSNAISGWDLNLNTEPYVAKGIQVQENFLDYGFVTKGKGLESSKNHENNPGTENEPTKSSFLKLTDQVLSQDDLEDKSYTVKNCTTEVSEISDHDTVCSCSHSNRTYLFDIVIDVKQYKSSICSCHTGSIKNEEFGSEVIKGTPRKLTRVRSFDSEENEVMHERSLKKIAASPEDSVLHEMFDQVLNLYGEKMETSKLYKPLFNGGSITKGLSRREAIDLKNLLKQCITYLAGGNNDSNSNPDHLLKQIRSRACVSGDGTERLAHYFADGIEARLAGGKGLPVHEKHALKSPYVDLWKAFKLYLTAFPFMETSYFFANNMIMTVAEKQQTSILHIIHFGIMQGLQWPSFIQSLSKRPGGPPKLRVTGIDFPQEGFLPDAMMEGTKHRLESLCKRFNVPFEYYGFVKDWETITLDDLKIDKDEVVVVNCLYHMMYLFDDTVVEHGPRDVVLRLIRKINPHLFVHVIVNGSYSSPFFMSRFREALFHFSTLFNMFDVILARDDPLRMVYERDIWGKEISNIIACEGKVRVERPETYKQWQLRSIRAGFKQLPLKEEIVKQVKSRLNSYYHKDFFMDTAGHWLLNGWKARALFALSCWEPVNMVFEEINYTNSITDDDRGSIKSLQKRGTMMPQYGC